MLSKKLIRQLAKKSGIDVVGFTSVDCLKDLKFYLKKRQQTGFACKFEEKSIKNMIDIKNIMPDANSIISVAICYNVSMCDESNDICYIAKFSRGEDYHKVLKDKMLKLISYMNKYKTFKYMCFVDTVPFIERWIAKKSGIGFYGKNCNIINKNYGSWIVLGEIVVDMKIKPDQPSQDECSSCNKCIELCPTGAIKPDYTIDSCRCISYITQKRGYILPEYRHLMANNLYGCDICQLVCPHNKHVHLSNTGQFMDDKYHLKVDPKNILTLTNSEYKKLYGNMALAWRGKKILQRNTIIAMGNSGDRRVLPILEKSLKDQRPDIRGYTVWAISRFNNKKYLNVFSDMLKQETDAMVRDELLTAIQRLKE